MSGQTYQLRTAPVKAVQFKRTDGERWKKDPRVHYFPYSDPGGGPPMGDDYDIYQGPGREGHIATLEDGDWILTHDDGMTEVVKDWDFKRLYREVREDSQ